MPSPTTNPTPVLGDVGIDLGPKMPIASYHAQERWHPERIGALALYCSDGRWGDAFDEFCHHHLQIPRYDRWAVPGGPVWFATSQFGPSTDQAIHVQLDFLVEVHQLERLVLITHFGCAWYGQKLNRSPTECLKAQVEDIKTAATSLRAAHPGLRLEAYLAMRQHEQLSFHELPIRTI